LQIIRIYKTIVTESSDETIKCGTVFSTEPFKYDDAKVAVSESSYSNYAFPSEFKLDKIQGNHVRIFDATNNQCSIITKKKQPAIKSPTGFAMILKPSEEIE